MRLILLLGLAALFWAPRPATHYRRDGPALLPDPGATPGAALPGATRATVCRPGYATRERDVPRAVKHAVYAEYGARPRAGICCEVDHLISLELGGSNDIRNLWPQPYLPTPGAREKDGLEDYLHRQVCSGALPLRQAQRELSGDWARSWRAARLKQP